MSSGRRRRRSPPGTSPTPCSPATPRPIGDWEVRHLIIQGLYPGETDRLVEANLGLLRNTVRERLWPWVKRFGYDEVYADALVGCMKGVVDYLWLPEADRCAISTYLVHGIVWYLGSYVPRHAGPIRLPKHVADHEFPVVESMADNDLLGGGRDADGAEAAEAAARILAVVDENDRRVASTYRAGDAVRMRFGFPPYHGPMEYEEIARRLGVTKQAVHQRVAKALAVARLAVDPDASGG